MPAHVLTGARAQATPLWAIVLVLAALLLVPVAMLARATIERAEAQSAADAAALAGALAGEDEARAVARLNGARVERYERIGDVVEVVVVVGGRRATARAHREDVPVPCRHHLVAREGAGTQVRCRRSGRLWRWSR